MGTTADDTEEPYWRTDDIGQDLVPVPCAPAHHLTFAVGEGMRLRVKRVPNGKPEIDRTAEIDRVMRTAPSGDCGCNMDGAVAYLDTGFGPDAVYGEGYLGGNCGFSMMDL